MWNKNTLKKLIAEKLNDRKFVMVTNREPYIHIQSKKGAKAVKAISGVTLPLDSIMQATHGMWFAYGSGSADKDVVNSKDIIKLPPNSHGYELKRVWLTKNEVAGYYYGYSNETIWPLCHACFIRPKFDMNDWNYYKKVNEKFAKSIISEIGDKKAFVWIHDYHFSLLPALLKKHNDQLTLAHFWHIPWPSAKTFRICPQKKEILEGLLANDMLAFQRHYFLRNFLETVSNELEAKVDFDNNIVHYKGKKTYIMVFPISVDYEKLEKRSSLIKVTDHKYINSKFYPHKYEKLILSVDRLEYTKGIIERIKSFDRFLEKYPEYLNKVVLVIKGIPSRSHIDTYRNLVRDIEQSIDGVNWKYNNDSWYPIHYINENLPEKDIDSLYKSADVCLITSLEDGMNLVSKEYVSCCRDDGVLVLSEFAGASREMESAIKINPYDIESLADSIKRSLDMPKQERVKRMKRLKEQVKDKNIYRWAGKFISSLFEIRDKVIKED
jgi:trehalose 6-phosphate synthase